MVNRMNERMDRCIDYRGLMKKYIEDAWLRVALAVSALPLRSSPFGMNSAPGWVTTYGWIDMDGWMG